MIDQLDRRLEKLLMLLARADGTFDRADTDIFRIDDGIALRRQRLSADLRALALERQLVEIGSGSIRLTETGRAIAARSSAHPQGFRLQHGAISAAPPALSEGSAGTLIDDAESPLAWLHRRKGQGGVAMVDASEFAAGERLRLDFTRAGMMPSVTSNWRDMASSGGGGRGGRAEMTDAALAARDRVGGALQALDPELAGVALDVCCFLKGLETVESERQWPQRSAKVVLKLALKALARHYGITTEATGGPGGGRVRHWGAADYRPNVGNRG